MRLKTWLCRLLRHDWWYSKLYMGDKVRFVRHCYRCGYHDDFWETRP